MTQPREIAQGQELDKLRGFSQVDESRRLFFPRIFLPCLSAVWWASEEVTTTVDWMSATMVKLV